MRSAFVIQNVTYTAGMPHIIIGCLAGPLPSNPATKAKGEIGYSFFKPCKLMGRIVAAAFERVDRD